MKKAIILFLSLMMLTATGCSNKKSTSIPSSSVAEAESTIDKLEYEFYIDNIDYCISNLATALDDEVIAIENEDLDELEKAYKKCIYALEDFYEIPCPENIKTEHEELMTILEREKKGYELLLKACDYGRNYDNLTATEQEELKALEDEIDEHFSYIDDSENMDLWNAKTKVIEAANKFI